MAWVLGPVLASLVLWWDIPRAELQAESGKDPGPTSQVLQLPPMRKWKRNSTCLIALSVSGAQPRAGVQEVIATITSLLELRFAVVKCV